MHKALLFITLLLFLSTKSFADCRDFQKALEAASKLRNLKILQPVNCKDLNSKEFSSIIKNANKSKPEIDEKIYKMIGLIPENYDYKNCFIKNDIESVMASYMPEDRTVYIPINSNSSFDLLVHEATHALQDQHFNLNKISKAAESSTDSFYSFLALVEGDAEIIQNRYLEALDSSRKSMEQQKKIKKNLKCEIPQALLFQLDFPYFWGARYVRVLKELNKTFNTYPKHSTEILYPNNKFKFSLPNKREVFKLVRKFYKDKVKLIQEDTMGEYTLRCIFRELIGSRFSVIASYGWRGDKLGLYKINNKHVLSWILNMHNNADAKELHNAFKKSLEKRFAIEFKTNADTIIYGNEFYPKIYLHRNKKQVQFLISELP